MATSNFAEQFKRMANELKDFAKYDMPEIVKTEALNHFEKSWDNQGFTDTNLQKWKPRKAPKRIGKRGKVLKAYENFEAKENRGILISHASDTKGTHLKDSNRGSINGDIITISNDKVYAKRHNEGIDMEKRTFIAPSQQMVDKILTKADKEIIKIVSK
jgi:hypothetical protein